MATPSKNLTGDRKNLAKPKMLLRYSKYLAALEKFGQTPQKFTGVRNNWLDLGNSAPTTKLSLDPNIFYLNHKNQVTKI